MSPLRRISIAGTEWVSDESTGAEALHVKDPHALIKAAGYLKFTHAGVEKSEAIYFRGERKIYESLSPTLFRGLHQSKAKEKKIIAVQSAIKNFQESCRIFQSFGHYAHEPLLQHYGVSTSWVDVVDNIWVALWFSCHQAKSSGDGGQYLHFEKRVPTSINDYAYILLIGADIERRNGQKPGYYFGKNTELVDLRMATPSVFLRPHAQHGLLFRCKGTDNERPGDYSKQIRGIVRVSLKDALDWLGEGKIVGTHSLFPPPFYDDGYRILLESGVDVNKSIGSISMVGA
ncbi:FRG domain-containing protein [Pseudomonas asiatica]|uniref:FRG domain-containing protein n=1 Tax=Pseudomonas asiatica TaxID=2219225 RepID=UPI0017492532|nr:FRG domain-containing protein [Pseudomonas asiatica]MCO7527363.1 FRG domain-containing protein [Pseudomonas asiatica]QOE07123.1 FRG domain-containing protein [Pseudomonas asiatica]